MSTPSGKKPSFNETPFRRVLPHAAAARAFLARLQERYQGDPASLRRDLPRVFTELKQEPAVGEWLEALMHEPNLNLYGPTLGAAPASHRDKLGHLLAIGMVLSPGIETLGTTQPAPPATGDPAVSIIILAWNHWEETAECLQSLFDLTRTPSYEVIVVDNGSNDETRTELPRLAACSPRLRALRSETNLGFSGGNNLGAEAARGEYLCFLNNDTLILERSWLRRMVDTLESDRRIGACGQFGVIDAEGELPGPNAFYQLCFLPGLTLPVAWLSGFCLTLKREAFAAAGRWRSDLYGLAGHEDIHLGYALRRAGWISVVPPRWVPVFHKIGRTRSDESGAIRPSPDLTAEEKEARFRKHFGSRRRRANYALAEPGLSDLSTAPIE